MLHLSCNTVSCDRRSNSQIRGRNLAKHLDSAPDKRFHVGSTISRDRSWGGGTRVLYHKEWQSSTSARDVWLQHVRMRWDVCVSNVLEQVPRSRPGQAGKKAIGMPMHTVSQAQANMVKTQIPKDWKTGLSDSQLHCLRPLHPFCGYCIRATASPPEDGVLAHNAVRCLKMELGNGAEQW